MPMQIFFFIIAAVTLISAAMVVTVRRMMHAALWLVLSLFGVAVLFAMLESSFYAVVQVIVYIGAIAILVIFAVMLTRHVMDDTSRQISKNWWAALVAVVIAFGGMVVLVLSWSRFQAGPGTSPSELVLLDFGKALTAPNQFAIPFEVSSVLLLAALIGSIFIAVERKGGQK